MSLAPDYAPVDLDQAELDMLTGAFGDLNADEILLEFARMQQPPYLVAGLGLAIGILCGLTFSKLVQNRLDGWKADRLAMLLWARLRPPSVSRGPCWASRSSSADLCRCSASLRVRLT